MVVVDTEVGRTLPVRNTGDRPLKFKAQFEKGLPLEVAPLEGHLGPHQSTDLAVKFLPVEKGQFSGSLTVTSVDQPDKPPLVVETTATVVTHGLDILTAAGVPITEPLDAGIAYFGGSQILRVTLVNNGPKPVTFRSQMGPAKLMANQLSQEGDAEVQGSASTIPMKLKAFQKVAADKTFSLEPDMGTIAAYEKLTITVTFLPNRHNATKGFLSNAAPVEESIELFDYLSIISVDSMKTKLKLPLQGRGIKPGVQIAPSSLQFGDVPVNGNADALTTITNTNKELPARFDIPCTPNFRAEPRRSLLPPGQSASVLITYLPKVLGKHREKIDVQIKSVGGIDIQTLALYCTGSSSQIGAKQRLTGGVDKLPEDFQRSRNYVEQEGFMERGTEKFTRKKLWDKPDTLGRFQELDDSSGYSLTVYEHKTRQMHRDHYTGFLKQERRKRTLKATAKQTTGSGAKKYGPEDPVNIGLQQASGLRSPRMELPSPDEPLWLDPKYSGDASHVRPRNRPPFLEEEHLQPGAIVEKPTTSLQARQCLAELPTHDICKLAIGPRNLDFGKISAMSKNTKYLAATNSLDRYIHIKVLTQSVPELKESKHLVQVVKPGATAVFPMTLVVPTVQTYKSMLTYVINDKHMFDIDVSAEVVPVSLNVNVEELHFEFTVDNTGETVQESLVLSNPSSHPAEFSWEPPSKAFTVTPSHGVVPGKSSVEAIVAWKPMATGNVGELLLRVIGASGPSKKIHLDARLPEGKINVREKSLNFSKVSIGDCHSQMFTIRNVGSSDTMFTVATPSVSGITIIPARGRVAAGSMTEVEVVLETNVPGIIDTVLSISARGGKTIKLPVIAEGIVPEVEIVEDEYQFGRVYIGGASRLPLTVVNRSPIPATLTIDLSQYPEFLVELPEGSYSATDYPEPPLRRIGTASVPGSALNNSSHPNTPGAGGPASVSGQCYKLSLKEEVTLKLQLAFRPVSVGKHAFELPVSLAGSTGEPAEDDNLMRAIVAAGLRPRLVVSTPRIEFGSKIVLRNNAVKIPYAMEIELTNNDQDGLQWAIGEPSTDKEDTTVGIFQFTPKSGTLPKGGSCKVRATFLPRDKRGYSATVPLYLDGNREKAYVELEPSGQGTYPFLSFNMREVTMPPVPLGVQSQMTFRIQNNGYDNLELQYRLPPDTSHAPLSLEFPDGHMIGMARENLDVVVSFTSPKPISFTSNLEFLDEDGNRYSIPISGVSDNCILSTHPFLVANSDTLKLAAEENAPITLKEGDFVLPEADIAAPGAVALSKHVLDFFNYTTMKGPFDNFPQDIISTKGRQMSELIEVLSGKTVPGKVSKFSYNKKEAANQLCGQYEKLLTFLKGHGALLNPVKPEFLLDLEDFKRVKGITEPLEEDTPRTFWHDMCDGFAVVSEQAWTSVMLQVFKIFVLYRFTTRQLRTIPGYDQSNMPIDRSMSGSNLYSISECVLLKWMTGHYLKAMPSTAARVTNFGTPLRDSMVFYSLLVSHWPPLESYYSLMKKSCRKESDFTENANTVVRMMSILKLPYRITPEEIVRPNEREMVIFVAYLYQTLPNLLPKSTVEFETKLGTEAVKSIEITNPSNKAISYSANLEGHDDFSILQPNVRLEPKSVATFSVAYTPTVSKPADSRLVLTSRKDGAAHAATLVFVLEGSVQVFEPLKRFEMAAKMYEYATKEIKVENPFPGDCELKVTVEHKEPENDPDFKGYNPNFPPPFGSERSKMRLKHKESTLVNLHFLPFNYGQQRCLIIFEDKEYGKFSYEVVGDAALPEPTAPVKFSCGVEQVTKEIPVAFNNPLVDAAKKSFAEKHPLSKKKEFMQLVRVGQGSIKDLTYTVESSSQFIHSVEAIYVKHGSQKGKPADGEPQGGPTPNVLPLTLDPRGPGIYPVRVVLSSEQDIRVVDAEFTVAKLAQQAELEFECPARQQIVQEVPMVNSSDKPLNVKAVCTGDSFSGPREITVPSNSTASYKLAFKAPWTGEYTGTLELSIASTGESISYKLKGVAEDPVAEDHKVIPCKAREETSVMLQVPNVLKKDVTYQVYTDFPFISGKRSLHVPPSGTAPYKVNINAPKSGVATGSISFTTDTGHYVWFTLELQVARPPEIGVIDVQSVVREAVAVSISLTNPLDMAVDFNVQVQGHGLVARPWVTIPPNAKVDYELVYSPLKAGEGVGLLQFANDTMGEFWYKLILAAEEAQPETIPQMASELGKTAVYEIEVQNPLGEEITLRSSSSNSRNFAVHPPSMIVAPFGAAAFQVGYMSSSLDALEEAVVQISSEEVGVWEYNCSGLGAPPTVMEAVLTSSTIGQSSSKMVLWRNPFPNPAVVNVWLDSEDEEFGEPNSFMVLLKKHRGLTVAPFSTLQIPVGFTPDSLKMATAMLWLEVEKGSIADLKWQYPIQGIAEAIGSGPVFHSECKVRASEESTMEVRLAGVDLSEGNTAFEWEVEFPADSAALKRALAIEPLSTRIVSEDTPLEFEVTFQPQMIFQATADLVVTQENGGRWRFQMVLEGTEADIDGTLTVHANVGSVGFLELQLPEVSHPTPFEAFFSPDSPDAFTVGPERGHLAPGEAGGALKISYAPTRYGKGLEGYLCLQTDDMQWIYCVKGETPVYIPPNKSRLIPKIDRTLNPATMQALEAAEAQKNTNHVYQNMSLFAQGRPPSDEAKGARPGWRPGGGPSGTGRGSGRRGG